MNTAELLASRFPSQRGVDILAVHAAFQGDLDSRPVVQAVTPASRNWSAAVPLHELRRAAYHEAGHAVALVALGGTVSRLAIHPDASGECLGGPPPVAANECIYSASGAAGVSLLDIGQARMLGTSYRASFAGDAYDRERHAKDSGLSGLQLDARWIADVEAALNVISAQGRCFHALAAALLERHALGRDEVAAIIAREFWN